MTEEEKTHEKEKAQEVFNKLKDFLLVIKPRFEVRDWVVVDGKLGLDKYRRFEWGIPSTSEGVTTTPNKQKDAFLLQLFCLQITQDIIERRFKVDQYNSKSVDPEFIEGLNESKEYIISMLRGIGNELVTLIEEHNYDKPKRFEPK